jgi:hypothetical protein
VLVAKPSKVMSQLCEELSRSITWVSGADFLGDTIAKKVSMKLMHGVAVWCDGVICDILTGSAQVTITKHQACTVMALRQDYEVALGALLVSLRDARALNAKRIAALPAK